MMEVRQSVVSLSLSIFFCFIGVPVWWQTTKVYRESLPYTEISSLATSTNHLLNVKVHWDVFIDRGIVQSNSTRFTPFTDSFRSLVQEKFPLVDIKIVYKQCNLQRAMSNLSDSNIKSSQALIDSIHNTIADRIKWMTGKKHEGYFHHNIVFAIMPLQMPNVIGMNRTLLLGASHVIVLLESLEHDELKKDIEWALSMMQETLFPAFDESTGGSKGQHSAEGASLHSSSGVDISFTLANANSFNSIVDWNIEHAICAEFMPFLQNISDFGPFSITSQILNFVDTGIEPKKLKGGGYFHSLKKLPLLINPLESHLNEYTSNKPILNFVLYIPQSTHAPLVFRDKKISYVSFTSPRWGSVIIKNLVEDSILSNSTHTIKEFKDKKLEVDSDMKLILSHFRELVGLKRIPTGGVFFASLDKAAVASWEVDYLFLKGTIDNLRKSASNLVSLASLLGKIANIVIRNDIRLLLEQAVQNITKSKLLLSYGQLRDSFLASKSAVVSSERAFYDHSLLALLYFPDDQKYAIYLPLFFPIFIPLLMTFVVAVRTIYEHHHAKIF